MERGGRSGSVWQLSPGEYGYEASLAGYQTTLGTFEVPATPTHRVEIIMDPQGVLRVWVVDSKDQPVPGSTWMIDGVAGPPLAQAVLLSGSR